MKHIAFQKLRSEFECIMIQKYINWILKVPFQFCEQCPEFIDFFLSNIGEEEAVFQELCGKFIKGDNNPMLNVGNYTLVVTSLINYLLIK